MIELFKFKIMQTIISKTCTVTGKWEYAKIQGRNSTSGEVKGLMLMPNTHKAIVHILVKKLYYYLLCLVQNNYE